MSKVAPLIVLFIFITSVATAHDLVVPSWRTDENAKYLEWRFDTSDNPAEPEENSLGSGLAIATMDPGEYGSGYYDDGGLGTQTGHWDLYGPSASMTINLDGLGTAPRELWLQVTYFKDLMQAPTVMIDGAALLSEQHELLVEETVPFGDWYLDQYVWEVNPGQNNLQISIIPDAAYGSLIDQVVIDTIPIPEPATGALLLVGVLLCRRVKR